jgi:alpha-beta hydrolase superfamily lysophospholipase
VLTSAPSVQTEHTQVWFGSEERPLFGWVSMPADLRARGGVVLCPPMGEESRAAHRTFRRLAEALAEQGLVALRFDYDGTGDSSGLQDDPDRVPAWLASIEAARGYLHELGVPSVAAVGMRLGATLAAAQAAAGGEFSSLVLWDPCLSGRSFLREGEALYSFVDDLGQPPDDGYRHTPGFQYDHATAAAMRTLDFGRLPTDRRLAAHLLLLNRTDRPVAEGVEKVLRAMPMDVETAPATAQDMLLDRTPSDCYVPEEALARVVTWLAEQVQDAVDVPVTSPAVEHPVVLGSAGPGSELVRERSLRIGDAGLFAVADEPLTPPHDADSAPWVVLVNVAVEHHIGPGRRWVEYARSWAGMGYRVLRLDQSGVGDSPTHPGQREDSTFAPEWIDDMRDVVRTLSASGAAVIMVGLCSGAYSAFEAAMWEQVAAVFAVNPRLTLFPAAKGSPVYTDRRRAAVLPARPVARLAEAHRILAGGIWRIYRQLAVWHAPFLVLWRVLRRGTEIQVIACRDDAQHFTEVAFWRPRLRSARRSGRLQLEQDDLIDHSLLARAAQVEAFERATVFIETQAARAAARRAS